MGDLMKRCGVIDMEIAASLSPTKRRKLDSQSPENSSSASPPSPASPASPASSICSDPNKKVEGSETDFSSFNFEDFSKEITPLEEEETEASSLTPLSSGGGSLTALSSGPVRVTPSEIEIEEFFSAAEKYEQKRFSEKYNYDIVKDVPLEGRYQWVKL